MRQRLAHQQFQRRVVVDVAAAITPQWPWSVYSHMHTSVITAQPGHPLLDLANRALHLAVIVPRLAADGVLMVGNAEQDDRRHARGRMVSRAALTTLSTDSCATPGIDVDRLASRRVRGRRRDGWIKSSGESRVSRTMRRIVSVRRSRRGRLIGNAIVCPSRPEEFTSRGTRVHS